MHKRGVRPYKGLLGIFEFRLERFLNENHSHPRLSAADA
jgi:hypothetical protein